MEIFEKIYDIFMYAMLLIGAIFLILLVVLFLCLPSYKERILYTSECVHKWEYISRTRLGHIVYCPECDVKISVSDSEWADILIDKKYGG